MSSETLILQMKNEKGALCGDGRLYRSLFPWIRSCIARVVVRRGLSLRSFSSEEVDFLCETFLYDENSQNYLKIGLTRSTAGIPPVPSLPPAKNPLGMEDGRWPPDRSAAHGLLIQHDEASTTTDNDASRIIIHLIIPNSVGLSGTKTGVFYFLYHQKIMMNRLPLLSWTCSIQRNDKARSWPLVFID